MEGGKRRYPGGDLLRGAPGGDRSGKDRLVRVLLREDRSFSGGRGRPED